MKSLLPSFIGLGGGATTYLMVKGGLEQSTANQMMQVVPTPGIISDLFIASNWAPTGWITVTLYVNGAPTALTASITGGATQASDTTHSVSVNYGDRIQYRVDKSAAPPATMGWVGAVFTGTTAKQSMLLAGRILPNNGADRNCPLENGVYWATDRLEAEVSEPCPTAGTLKNLYVHLSTFPGAGKSYTFTVYKNGVATALTVTISGAAVSGNVTADVAVAEGDTLSMLMSPANGPAVTYAYWGVAFEAATDGESVCLSWGERGGAGPTWDLLAALGMRDWGSDVYQGGVGSPRFSFKKLYVKLSAASANVYELTVSKNHVDTALAVAIPAGNTTGSDLVHTVTVGDYDGFSMKCNAPAHDVHVTWGFVVGAGPLAAGGNFRYRMAKKMLMGL